MMFRNKILILSLFSLLFGLTNCRGWVSDKPPVHVNPNMDTQPKYKPYRASTFFEDKRDMRPLVEGTVARTKYNKKNSKANLDKIGMKGFPKNFELDKNMMLKGKMKFDVYCAPCHDRTGNGNGMVGRRLTIPPTNLHSDYMYQQSNQHYFDVITNGIRTMPAYAHQIPIEDRWAIVAYVRALQDSMKRGQK